MSSGTGSFGVETGELKKAGEGARKVAEAMPGDVKKLYGPCDTAVAGLSGWRTAKALDECVEAWGTALKSLASMVDAAGDKLVASAEDFSRTDQERRADFQRANQQPLFPGAH